MNRNTRVNIFLTAIAIFIFTIVGFVIYVNISFVRDLEGFHKTIKKVVTPEEKSQSKGAVIILSRNVHDLKAYALDYKPTEIDFSENDTLNMFDLKYIYSRRDKESIEYNNDIANIMLLKLYLSHLKNYHQGYDLISMRRGQVKYIIDYYFQTNKIDTISEMYNTGSVYEIVKAKKNSITVNKLLRNIERERKRLRDNRDE